MAFFFGDKMQFKHFSFIHRWLLLATIKKKNKSKGEGHNFHIK
jgi:hypothetical protein